MTVIRNQILQMDFHSAFRLLEEQWSERMNSGSISDWLHMILYVSPRPVDPALVLKSGSVLAPVPFFNLSGRSPGDLVLQNCHSEERAEVPGYPGALKYLTWHLLQYVIIEAPHKWVTDELNFVDELFLDYAEAREAIDSGAGLADILAGRFHEAEKKIILSQLQQFSQIQSYLEVFFEFFSGGRKLCEPDQIPQLIQHRDVARVRLSLLGALSAVTAKERWDIEEIRHQIDAASREMMMMLSLELYEKSFELIRNQRRSIQSFSCFETISTE